MKLSPILLIFVSCVVPALGIPFPDFSDDHYEEDISEDSQNSELISDLRWHGDGKPRLCRRDICDPDISLSYEKGDIYWPKVAVGVRFYSRCPYAVNIPVYAYRECIIDPNDNIPEATHDAYLYLTANVTWAAPNIENCPGPPLEELLKRIKPTFILGSMTNKEDSLGEVNHLVTLYDEQPVRADDVTDIIDLLDMTMAEVTSRGPWLTTNTLRAIFSTGEFILDHYYWVWTGRYRNRFMYILTLMTEMWPSQDGEPLRSSLIGRYYSVIASRVTGSGEVTLHMDMTEPNKSSPLNVTVRVYDPGDHTVHVLYFGMRDLLDEVSLGQSDFIAPPVILKETLTRRRLEPKSRTTRDILENQNHTLTANDTENKNNSHLLIPPVNLTNRPENDLVESRELLYDDEDGILNDTNASGDLFEPDEIFLGINAESSLTKRLISAICYVAVTEGMLEDTLDKDLAFKPTWHRTMVNATVQISIQQDAAFDEHHCGSVDLRMNLYGDDGEEFVDINQQNDFSLDTWYPLGCQGTMDNLQNPICKCLRPGYVGIFSPMTEILRSEVDFKHKSEILEGSLSLFLGFPFVYELWVAGHVFRSLSLVCLLVTVLSFALHRRVRRGRPTQILINLCVSLILLLIVLYVSAPVATSEWGCRVANVLRYYFVMTSLTWNAVEAVNMYLMLVRVFNSEVTGFIWKASLAAWGIPLVGIAIVLAVSRRGFDGIHDVVHQRCHFSCSLRPNVLYFAYLLPMLLIITHNIVIFGLVIRVLLQHGENRPEGSKRRHWVNLCGAFSMMVLLGVPWVFSAFGAIGKEDHDLKLLEGVFQVVFVVFINLQGVFIFLFHCVRNGELRSEWKTTMSTLRSSTNSSSLRYSSHSESTSKKTKSIKNKHILAPSTSMENGDGTTKSFKQPVIVGIQDSDKPKQDTEMTHM